MSFQEARELLCRLQHMDLTELCKELADEGADVCSQAYSGVLQPGNDSYQVYSETIENGARIVATGHDVGFLEFGAGLTVDESDTFAALVPYAVHPGSWSEEHEKQFTSKGYWRFMDGDKLSERITSLSPTRGMNQALDYVTDEAERRVKDYVSKRIHL